MHAYKCIQNLKWYKIKLHNHVQEVEDPSEVLQGKNHLEDQSSSTEIAIIIDDVINRKPRFYQTK
jgi:N-acetyl-gamma-glutamylphosphate reductase